MGLLLANAVRDTEVRGAARTVLKELALMAQDAKGWCWPSVEFLAGAAALSVRSVYRALAELAERGLIRVTHGGGRGRVNRYLVCLKAVCGKPVDAPEKTVTSCRENPDTESGRKGSEKKEEKVAPKRPVDRSGPWARGFSHLSGFFATSSFVSSGPGTPSRPGGSPLPALSPFTTPARSTTASAGCSSASQSVAELVAEFLAERQGVPR